MICEKCNAEMERKNVAPCALCGAKESEIKKFLSEGQFCKRVSILGSKVVLCTSCIPKVKSYHPEAFGLPGGEMEDFIETYDDVSVQRKQEITDFVCGKCVETMAWQKTLKKVRENARD